MTFEEMYAAARAAEFHRENENSRHLAELKRLNAAATAGDGTTDHPRPPSTRLRRSMS